MLIIFSFYHERCWKISISNRYILGNLFISIFFKKIFNFFGNFTRLLMDSILASDYSGLVNNSGYLKNCVTY